MKETSFIEQNKDKWKRFERAYSSTVNDPEELSDLYMDLTDDLSYAQTFYKRRTVRVYLNQLAQMVFSGVHKQKGETFKKFISVWKTSLPLEIYRSRKHLSFALICFLIYATIGVVSAHIIPNFSEIVLGGGYIEETNHNIQQGNPLGIYEDEDQLSMFIRITTNNLKVSFLTFFVGFLFTIGTHILLFTNSVMVGVFQNFFYMKGLLITSFLGIWIHGAFEISSIVIAAGAGFTVGNGWLFPESYTRLQSLQLSTKRGLKIMLSIVPFIVMAGFLESFVTANYQELPDWSKWMLILLSFGIILFFYVIYPIYVARKHPELIDSEEIQLLPRKTDFITNKIKTLSEMVSDTFRFYGSYFEKIGKIIFVFVLPLALLLIYFQDLNHYNQMETEHWFDWVAQCRIMMGYNLENIQDGIIFIFWTVLFSFLHLAVYWAFESKNEPFSWGSYFRFLRHNFIKVWIACIVFYLLILLTPWPLMILSVVLLSFFNLVPSTLALDKTPLKERIKKGFRFSKNYFGSTLLLIVLFSIFIALLAQPIAFVFSNPRTMNQDPFFPDLLDMLANFVKRIAKVYTEDYIVIGNIVRQFIYILFIFFITPLWLIITSFAYYNELEKTEAPGLRKEFEKFGKRNRFRETLEDYDA